VPDCRVKRALLSVSDKTGIVEFSMELVALGVEIVSTGGTHKTLTDAGIPVIYVSEATGFPEILDGRVKTLHPAIHGGVLARRSDPEHLKELNSQGITPIDLVAVNLYPFQRTASRPDASWEELIENIDIGGPSMARSAAKNHEDVLVIVHPEDYGSVLRHLRTSGDCPREERLRLALAAFRHTGEYDACIFEALQERAADAKIETADRFPSRMIFALEKISGLRYGENPGQFAALYRDARVAGRSFVDAAQLQGKELSYNNWLDSDSAFGVIRELDPGAAAAVIVKHTNPCGASAASTLEIAFERAYSSDPVSAYGGIVAVNRPVSDEMARMLRTFFQEVVIAPAYTDGARSILKDKPSLRLLEVPQEAWSAAPWDAPSPNSLEWRSVQGGLLAQSRDLQDSVSENWKTVTSKSPSSDDWPDIKFAWAIVKHVKSNAIVLAKNGATVGIGAGQPNRVGAAEIALKQAGEKARGAILASDAFFPFPDAVQLAGEYGIKVIVQPGGSLRDKESIDAADGLGIAMVHTGVRHFKH
jgi:phosphoribosylaminoimidazolecarboxamide formyltransferase/IMP cyclohydrolase